VKAREAVARMVAVLTPWMPKRERKAAIAKARTERKAAQAKLAAATAVKADIGRMVYDDNHFAARIIETLRDRPRGRPENGQ
jgi:hypothetical protein